MGLKHRSLWEPCVFALYGNQTHTQDQMSTALFTRVRQDKDDMTQPKNMNKMTANKQHQTTNKQTND